MYCIQDANSKKNESFKKQQLICKFEIFHTIQQRALLEN